jgi:hypothetical protein
MFPSFGRGHVPEDHHLPHMSENHNTSCLWPQLSWANTLGYWRRNYHQSKQIELILVTIYMIQFWLLVHDRSIGRTDWTDGLDGLDVQSMGASECHSPAGHIQSMDGRTNSEHCHKVRELLV